MNLAVKQELSLSNYNIFIIDYRNKIFELIYQIQETVQDSSLYERVRSGFQVLIVGPPNSGKSSLMNYLGKSTLILFLFINFSKKECFNR